MSKAFVIDNGGGFVKCGWSTDDKPTSIHNATGKSRSEKKFFVGKGIDSCRDFSSLFVKRSFEKGYCVDWETQKAVWRHICSPDLFDFNAGDVDLIVSEPVHNPSQLKEYMDELVFEELGFNSYTCLPAPKMAFEHFVRSKPDSIAAKCRCGMVVDAGFSFTHVVPIVNGEVSLEHVIRMDIGGKHLTNWLKDTISYRSLNLMDEFFLVNDIKEKTAFVASDFRSTLRQSQHSMEFSKDYVLPNGVDGNVYGYVLQGKESSEKAPNAESEDQSIPLNNERFTTPEILFRPSLIGLDQAGVAENVQRAASALGPELGAACISSLMPCGGGAQIPGFCERLMSDVRSWAQDSLEVQSLQSEDLSKACNAAWYGGCALAQDRDSFNQNRVSREEYNEHGHKACRRKF